MLRASGSLNTRVVFSAQRKYYISKSPFLQFFFEKDKNPLLRNKSGLKTRFLPNFDAGALVDALFLLENQYLRATPGASRAFPFLLSL
jgi:hypothetical protein